VLDSKRALIIKKFKSKQKGKFFLLIHVTVIGHGKSPIMLSKKSIKFQLVSKPDVNRI
jgi:hypothetical protein